MKSVLSLMIASLMLGACSGSGMVNRLMGGRPSSDPVQNVPVGNALAMPPDLQLKAPAGTNDNYQSNAAPDETLYGSNSAAAPQDLSGPAPVAPAPIARAAPSADVYAKYGIEKMKPDGKPKTAAELAEELRLARLAEKRQTNPNYGTVKNLSNIFSDG